MGVVRRAVTRNKQSSAVWYLNAPEARRVGATPLQGRLYIVFENGSCHSVHFSKDVTVD